MTEVLGIEEYRRFSAFFKIDSNGISVAVAGAKGAAVVVTERFLALVYSGVIGNSIAVAGAKGAAVGFATMVRCTLGVALW